MKTIYSNIRIEIYLFIFLLFFCFGSLLGQITFNPTGGPQTYNVPPCTNSLSVTLTGAGGGGPNGGYGAQLNLNIPVQPGDVVTIIIGQSATGTAGGYPNGGNGSAANNAGNASYGGGGSSMIYVNGVLVAVAGGGGGQGGGSTDASAADGGCASGSGTAEAPFGVGGGNGTQTAGGSAGPPWISSGNSGTAGSYLQGGNGGSDPCYNVAPGGGGGGGYYGGGGGGSDCFDLTPYGGGAGGGGSSLIPAGSSCTPNVNSGNGSAVVGTGTGIAASNTGPYCAGSTIQLNGSASPGSVYSWTGPNGFVSNLQNPTIPNATTANAGTYSLTISGGACTGTITTNVVVVAKPTPNAGIDQFVCLGTPISLTGIVSTPGNTYQWSYIAPGITPAPTVNFSPNTSNVSPTVTVNQVGNYYFIFREQNSLCPIQRDTVLINVSELNISATTVSPSCGGYSDGYININSPGAVQYSYDGGATWVSNSSSGNFSAGTYNICGRTANGCQKCINITITDPIPITVSVSNDTLICQNGTAYLSASGSGGTTYLYHWDFTGNTNSSQSVNPIVNTTYTVIAESESGCLSQPNSIDVTIRAPLTGTITNGDTVCPTYSSDIFANVVGGIGAPYTFVWSTGATQTGPDNHMINITPNVTSTYTVTVTDECESSPLIMSTVVRVAPLPVPSYTVLNPYQCEPAIFDIVNTTDSVMSQYIYWLVDGEQQFFNQDTIQTTELWGGQYDIQMIATSYEGCVDSLTFTNALHVEFSPVANFNFTPSPVTMFNTSVFMQNQSINASSYQWYFDQGNPAYSEQEYTSVLFPDGETGDYEVTLIVMSDLGCTDTITKIIEVVPEFQIYAPNTFTPNGDQFNQTWKVYMEGVDIQSFQLLLYNRWGEVIWESHDLNIGWDGTYKGVLVPTGTYVWVVDAKNTNNDGKYRFTGHVNLLH